jgi:hypothetical protein
VTFPAFTPELLRNARIQLRPGRMLSAAAICAALSITSWTYYAYGGNPTDFGRGYLALFKWLLFFQTSVLALGGGIYCLQSIHREKELNTFDFQRITRLSPLELTIGKLFGAPLMAYFAFLCLMPASLAAAFLSPTPFGVILQAYLVLLLGSVLFHALAMLISLLVGRSGSAGVILSYLLFVTIASMIGGSAGIRMLTLGRVSPYFALDLLGQPANDVFFGIELSHTAVLVVICLTFTAWFLVSVVRNIKRDPAYYEVYSPLLAFGLVLYVDLLVLGFFNWKASYSARGRIFSLFSPAQDLQFLLSVNLWLFVILGFALLRNRDRVRRRIREFGPQAADWLAATWPASYTCIGAIAVGLVTLEVIKRECAPLENWNMGMAVFQVAFLAVWLARDVLYLQWMSLRRTGHPLVSAVLYLIVFYICAGVLLSAFGAYAGPGGAFLVPTPVFGLDRNLWDYNQGPWILALSGQAAEALVFVWLQRQSLRAFVFASTQAAD